MARTMFVNPSDKQKEIYTTVTDCMDHIMEKMTPGTKLSELYEAAKSFLKKSKNPELADKLGKNIGFGMGIVFRESALVISPKVNKLFLQDCVEIECFSATKRSKREWSST